MAGPRVAGRDRLLTPTVRLLGATMQEMAGPTRFELATSGVTGRRSNQLNYDPAGSKGGA